MYRILMLSLLIAVAMVQHAAAQDYHTRKDTIWKLERYAPKDGAVIGIWPHELRIADYREAYRLHHYFGFSHIYFNINHGRESYRMLNNAGFAPGNIMVQMIPANFRQRIREFPAAYAYYIDEPFENDLSTEGMREFIDENSPGSLFIISGYRRTSGLNGEVSKADGVMFSSYKHWWQCLPGVWCTWPFDDDQRPDWTDMKERYGMKSFTNWVGSHRDTLEFYELLKHARDLNLKGVWLYQYQDPHNSEKNLFRFSEAAWTAGFLIKYERKYIYEFRCKAVSISDCKWDLYKITSTDEMRRKVQEDKSSKIQK